MKEIDDKNIINNILDNNIKIRIYDIELLNYIVTAGLDLVMTKQASTLLDLDNIFNPILFIPLLGIHELYNLYTLKKYEYNRRKQVLLELSKTIKILNYYGIKVTMKSLKHSLIMAKKLNNNHKKINIIYLDKDNCLQILQKHISLSKNNQVKKLYLLDRDEVNEEIKSFNNKETLSLESFLKNESKPIHNKKEINSRKKTIIRNILIHQFRHLALALVPIISLAGLQFKKEYSSFSEYKNTKNILNYYDDSSSVSTEEIKELLNIVDEEIKKDTDNFFFDISSIDTKTETDSYLLLYSIATNSNINQEEKEVFYNFYNFFNDNPYLNNKDVYERLKDLNLNKSEDEDNSKKIDGITYSIVANYNPYYNEITYYEKPSEVIIGHEATHCIISTYNMPLSLVEGMAEIISHEYFLEEDEAFSDYNAYNRNTALTKALIEIVGKDTMLKAFSNDNINYIREKLIDQLVKQDVSLSEATLDTDTFLKNIDMSFHDSIDKEELDNINIEDFYIYGNNLNKDLRFKKIVNDFYNGYEPNIEYYYFNKDKTLVKSNY